MRSYLGSYLGIDGEFSTLGSRLAFLQRHPFALFDAAST